MHKFACNLTALNEGLAKIELIVQSIENQRVKVEIPFRVIPDFNSDVKKKKNQIKKIK
jgi:hypothetical protein